VIFNWSHSFSVPEADVGDACKHGSPLPLVTIVRSLGRNRPLAIKPDTYQTSVFVPFFGSVIAMELGQFTECHAAKEVGSKMPEFPRNSRQSEAGRHLDYLR
jgi:hypothetical protein